MKRHQYRCNRCLILENRLLPEEADPLCAVPCPKCGGLAIRLPISESLEGLFDAAVAGATTITDCSYRQSSM